MKKVQSRKIFLDVMEMLEVYTIPIVLSVEITKITQLALSILSENLFGEAATVGEIPFTHLGSRDKDLFSFLSLTPHSY